MGPSGVSFTYSGYYYPIRVAQLGHMAHNRVMAEVKPEFRARLEAAGLWKRFNQRRQDLREGGASGVQARDVCVAEFELLLARPGDVVRVVGDPGRVSDLAAPAPRGKRVPVSAEVSPEEEGIYLRMTLAAKGKKASTSVIRQWVEDNLLIPLDQIDFETVPAQRAPAYLQAAKGCPRDFTLKMLPKITGKGHGDDEAGTIADDNRRNDELLAEFRSRLAKSGGGSCSAVG